MNKEKVLIDLSVNCDKCNFILERQTDKTLVCKTHYCDRYLMIAKPPSVYIEFTDEVLRL